MQKADRDFRKKTNFDKEKIFKSFEKLKILVVGETIIDQYFFCETLGKSGKDPILQMHEFNTETYIGGAAAIAGNLSKFCNCVSESNCILAGISSEKNSKSKFPLLIFILFI